MRRKRLAEEVEKDEIVKEGEVEQRLWSRRRKWRRRKWWRRLKSKGKDFFTSTLDEVKKAEEMAKDDVEEMEEEQAKVLPLVE